MNRVRLYNQFKPGTKTQLPEGCYKVTEHNKLVSIKENSTSETKYRSRHVIEKVPVSAYTKNLNGIIYPKKLWEKVYNDGTAERTACLSDHPEGEDDSGSVSNICGVWHNMSFDDEYVYADLYVIGDKGDMLVEYIDAGGRAGMSSAGWGHVGQQDEVDPETFIIERLADWVFEPSQQVYATHEENRVLAEDTHAPKTNLQESKGDKKMEQQNETNNVVVDSVTKLLESNLKNQIKNAIKQSKQATNTGEAIQILKEQLSVIPEGYTDLQESVNTELEALGESVTVELQENQKALVNVKKASVAHKNKADLMLESLNLIRSRYKRLEKSLFEERDANEELDTRLGELKEDYTDLMHKARQDKSKLDVLIENEKVMQSDINQLVEDRNYLQRIVHKLEKKLNLTEEVLNPEDVATNKTKDANEFTPEELEKDAAKDMDDLEKELMSSEMAAQSVMNMTAEDGTVPTEGSEINKIPAMDEIDTDSILDDETEMINDDAEVFDISDQSDLIPAGAVDDDGYSKIQSSRKRVRHEGAGRKRDSQSEAIRSLYESEVAKSAGIKQIKDLILGAKSLTEASRIIRRYENKVNDKVVRLKEGVDGAYSKDAYCNDASYLGDYQ